MSGRDDIAPHNGGMVRTLLDNVAPTNEESADEEEPEQWDAFSEHAVEEEV